MALNKNNSNNSKQGWTVPRDPPYTGMLRDLMMNLLGAACYYFGRQYYYGNILHITEAGTTETTTTSSSDDDLLRPPVYYFNNLWWVAFVPLFSSRFPQHRGLGLDMMLKGWIGASCALIWLCITMGISPTNWSWLLVAVFLDGFGTHMVHVRDRTWLAFNVFHLMLYWSAVITSYFHHISINTNADTESGDRVDWDYVTLLAYSFFVPYSIGTIIAIGCHLLFCPISSTKILQTTLHQTGHDVATIFRTFRDNMISPATSSSSFSQRQRLEHTIQGLQEGGTKVLTKRNQYRQQVAHAYLETRWKFSNFGYILEQRAANQARVAMTVNAFCDDVTYRLQRVLNLVVLPQVEDESNNNDDVNNNKMDDFKFPEELETVIHDTETFIDDYSKTHLVNHISHMTGQKKPMGGRSVSKTDEGEKKDTAKVQNDDEEEAVPPSSSTAMPKREEGERIIHNINVLLQHYTTANDQWLDIASHDTTNTMVNGGGMASSWTEDPIVAKERAVVDRLFVTILYSLRNVILSLITNDTLFINTTQTGGGYQMFEDWRHHDPIGMQGILSWSSHTVRSSIQQGVGLVILTTILVYMYGAEAGTTPGSFAINTYCSVLRQVFVGWACCRVLVRCGGFFLGWLVAGIVYAIAKYGFEKNLDDEGSNSPPVTVLFFIVHMILCLFMTSQKFRVFKGICGKEKVRDTGEGDPHMYVSYSMVVAWIVISNGWYGNQIEPITMHDLCLVGIGVWTELFRDLVVQALLASGVAVFILAFLFPSFAIDYLRQRLGMMLDVYQTWFNITTVVDGKHKLTDLHHRVLHDIAHQSDLLFLKIQRNTTKSLMVELWFQRVWTLLKTFNFLIPEERNRELQYHETAVAHLHALEFSRRIWISLWELSPEIGPQGKHFGLPDSHYQPHSVLNNDYISAIAELCKAYYGAPYSNVYRFALPARLPNSLAGGRPSDVPIFAPESFTLEGLMLEGSTTRLGNALYDWMHLVNGLYGYPGLTWPCLHQSNREKKALVHLE